MKNRSYTNRVISADLNLPTIQTKNKSTKSKRNMTDRKPIKHFYENTMATLTSPTEYESKDLLFLKKEQSHLKKILKKINIDTIKLIDQAQISPNFTSRQSKITEIAMVRDKEIENSKKIINNCVKQIESLKEKYVKIASCESVPSMTTKINKLRAQIEIEKSRNHQMNNGIHRMGNEMSKGGKSLEELKVSSLEMETYNQTLKLTKLRLQDEKIESDIEKTKRKYRDFENRFGEAEKLLNQYKSKERQESDVRMREFTSFERKNQIDITKRKKQQADTSYHYKYYKMLRQLEQLSSNINIVTQKIENVVTLSEQKKIEVDRLQKKCEEIKRSKLEKTKKAKQFIEEEKAQKIFNNTEESRLQDFTEEGRLWEKDQEKQENSEKFENEFEETKKIEETSSKQIKQEDQQKKFEKQQMGHEQVDKKNNLPTESHLFNEVNPIE